MSDLCVQSFGDPGDPTLLLVAGGIGITPFVSQLADLARYGQRRDVVVVLLVGPGGVFVVDVKNWRDVRLESGRLWRGDADADDEVRKLLDQTDAVEQLLAAEGLPPTEVVPLLVLAGRRAAEEVSAGAR